MKIKKSLSALPLALAVMLGIMVGASASDVVETITATLDSTITVVYNGDVQEMKDANGSTVYPIIYEGTTYLPVRAVSNLLGLEVNWDGPTRTVWLGEGFVATPEETPASDAGTSGGSGSTGNSGGKYGYGTYVNKAGWVMDLLFDIADYPAGKSFTVDGKTYVSTGVAYELNPNFIYCNATESGGLLVDPITGTTIPYSTFNLRVDENGIPIPPED